MLDGANVIYLYDGSFGGLMSCVFECFSKKQLPVDIIPQSEYEPTLYECREITYDPQRARRVIDGLKRKVSLDAYNLVSDSFLTCLERKEIHILEFIEFAFERGNDVTMLLGNEKVSVLTKAVRHLGAEANHMLGFVRFSIYEDAMVSVIEPQNYVLPVIAAHFCDRYPYENLMIYDKTHKSALIWCRGRREIVPIDSFVEPEADEEEYCYRSLWKMFYDTIAIKERENPKCRMAHMAKHYWSHLTEMNEANTAPRRLSEAVKNRPLQSQRPTNKA